MKRVLEHATDESSLVLDFFAGSGTMAQAVLELNAEDGGARRFIAVQLPERCPPGSAAARAGFTTVAEICKARARRAGRAVSEAPGQPRPDADAGFRLLRVDSTNMADVLRTPDELAQGDAGRFTETVKPDRTKEDVLFEVLASSGLELSAPVTVELIDGREVFVVADGDLIACLAKDVSPPVVREIAHRAPSRAVFLDSAFAIDADRLSAWRVFAGVSPATDLRVI
jgi:adenine-specific DNA-methyltransferase